jgi:hypothetical protein
VSCLALPLGLWPPATAPAGLLSDEQVGLPLSLKQVGCSDRDDDTVPYAEARNPSAFNWFSAFFSALLPKDDDPILLITLGLALGLYCLIRAIG